MAAIGEMASGMAHEINNPLMIIMGHAEILKKLLPDQNEKVERKLTSIISECHRISEVTKKLKEIKNPIFLGFFYYNQFLQKVIILVEQEVRCSVLDPVDALRRKRKDPYIIIV